MKRSFLLPAVLACLFPVGAAGAHSQGDGGPEAPLIGRCHMGGCAWFSIRWRDPVRTVGDERLLQLSVAEGGSEHPDNRYPTDANGVAITWNLVPENIYVLCSTRRPTMILRQDMRWQAVSLDFVRGPYGPTEFVSAQYVAACHPGEDMNRPGFATRRGYGEVSDDAGSIDLASPDDIFEPRR